MGKKKKQAFVILKQSTSDTKSLLVQKELISMQTTTQAIGDFNGIGADMQHICMTFVAP